MTDTDTDTPPPTRLDELPAGPTRLAWRCIRVLGASYPETARYAKTDVAGVRRRVTRLDLYLRRHNIDPEQFAANEVANIGPDGLAALRLLVTGKDGA